MNEVGDCILVFLFNGLRVWIFSKTKFKDISRIAFSMENTLPLGRFYQRLIPLGFFAEWFQIDYLVSPDAISGPRVVL